MHGTFSRLLWRFNATIVYFTVTKNQTRTLFQAGPSFDLPDREKMRRNGWSTEPPMFGQTNGHGIANRNMIFNATESPIRRSAVKHPSRIRDELLTDSSVENIRYQAVEGLVQENRQKRLARQVSSNLSPV